MHLHPLRIGILGTDTSHAPAFAALLNQNAPGPGLEGARITDAVPGFSADIPCSASRHAGFTRTLQTRDGVRLHPHVASMAPHVDAFILHSIDGRKHRSELELLLPFRKPVFVDKPFAASLADAIWMFSAAESANVPVFSASAYRFYPSFQEVLRQDVGRIFHAQSVGPCHLEPSHPDLFWYGIHAAEALFAILGPDCECVHRTSTADTDVVTGRWKNGATGILTGLRAGPMPHGVCVYGENGTVVQAPSGNTAFGAADDYTALVTAVVGFFRSGIAPVPPRETLALFAFLEAAEKSKTSGRTEWV
jgi:predicted dehydrogenase